MNKNLDIFDHLNKHLDLLYIFFLILKMRSSIYCFIFIFQVKIAIPSFTSQNHSKILHFMFLVNILFVLHPNICLDVFHYFDHMAAPHLKFSTRFSPSIILTQQSVWLRKMCSRVFMVWFGTKAAKIGDFGHLNCTFGH